MEQIQYLISLFKIEEPMRKIFSDYNTFDNEVFYKTHKKWLSKQYDLDDWCLNQESSSKTSAQLAIEYMIGNLYFSTVDWSGEEYPGQVKKYLNQRLKAMGITNVKLDDKKLRKTVNEGKVKRGEHIPLLFQLFENQLTQFDIHILIINLEVDDEYKFTIVDNSHIDLFDGTNCAEISFELPVLYKIYLDEIDNGKRVDMILHLKKTMEIETKQARLIVDKLPIEIVVGWKSTVEKAKKLLEDSGATKTTMVKYISAI